MSTEIFGELIAFLSIVGGMGAGVFAIWTRPEERKIQLRRITDNTLSQSTLPEIGALRDELARLRDTSAQFDISIQHSLETLQQRMDNLKKGARAACWRGIRSTASTIFLPRSQRNSRLASLE